MNSQAARFFLYEKWFKSWKKAEKKGKIKRKKLQKNFCLDASTCRDEMPLIKVAYFMLNFLNLKSFLSNLFFAVASSLSTLWIILQLFLLKNQINSEKFKYCKGRGRMSQLRSDRLTTNQKPEFAKRQIPPQVKVKIFLDYYNHFGKFLLTFTFRFKIS